MSTCPVDDFVGGAWVFLCSGVGITHGARLSRMCSRFAGGGPLPVVPYEVERAALMCMGSKEGPVSCCNVRTLCFSVPSGVSVYL